MNVSGSLYISSNDKKDYEDYQLISYKTTNNQPLSCIALNSFDFVYGLNNINSKNSSGFFETATQSFQVTLTVGNYTYASLLTEILLKLNALGLGVFAMTFINNIYTLTAPVAIKFITNPISQSRDWVDMVGFQKNTTLKTVHIGGVANIAYTNCIYITCDELHRRQTVRDDSTNQKLSNILGVVYINKDALMSSTLVTTTVVDPKHITDRIRNPKYIYLDINMRINTMTIRLLDENGNPLPAASEGTGSCSYTLELMCFDQQSLGT